MKQIGLKLSSLILGNWFGNTEMRSLFGIKFEEF